MTRHWERGNANYDLWGTAWGTKRVEREGKQSVTMWKVIVGKCSLNFGRTYSTQTLLILRSSCL